MKQLIAACALVTVALVAFASPAFADADDYGTTLQFTVQDAAEGSGYQQLEGWYLGCDPVRGTHPDARGACQTLEAVDGWVSAVTPSKKLCTKEYKPVQVFIEGYWNNRSVWYGRQFDNRCLAAVGTSNLFPLVK